MPVKPAISRRGLVKMLGLSACQGAFSIFTGNDFAYASPNGSLVAKSNTLDLIYDTEIFRNDGWGNTTLIRQSDHQGKKHFMLCDGSKYVSGDELLAWLREQGVEDEIDAIYISHWHADHMGAICGKDGVVAKALDAGIHIRRCITKAYDKSYYDEKGNQAEYEHLLRTCVENDVEILGISTLSAYGPSAAAKNKVDTATGSRAEKLFVPFTPDNTVFNLGDAVIRLMNWETFDAEGNALADSDIISKRQHCVNPNFDSLGVLIQYDDRKFWLAGDIMNCPYNEYTKCRKDDHDAGTALEGDEHRLAPIIGIVDVMQLGHHNYDYSNTDTYMSTLFPSLCTNTARARVAATAAADINTRYAPVVEMSRYVDERVYVIRYDMSNKDKIVGISAEGDISQYSLRRQVKAVFMYNGKEYASAVRYAPEAIDALPDEAKRVYSNKIGADFPAPPPGIELGKIVGWKSSKDCERESENTEFASPDTAVVADVYYEACLVDELSSIQEPVWENNEPETLDPIAVVSGVAIASCAGIYGVKAVSRRNWKKKEAPANRSFPDNDKMNEDSVC